VDITARVRVLRAPWIGFVFVPLILHFPGAGITGWPFIDLIVVVVPVVAGAAVLIVIMLTTHHEPTKIQTDQGSRDRVVFHLLYHASLCASCSVFCLVCHIL